jgi:arylsulfatase A-like enzyme
MLMDFFPTFCEVAGIEISPDIDGMSILPTLLGQEQNTDERYVFWVRREGGTRYGGQAYYAARFGDYKLLQNSAYEPFQYFNIVIDKYEQNPLDLQEDETFMKIRQNLEQHIRKSGGIPWQKIPVK